MPRTGGVYSAPAGTKGIPNTTVASNPYNSFIDDLVADANAARPITAGGTGATTATAARTNLGALASADILAAAQKATPVDADGFVITDSQDSGALKRTLWSSIKTTLQTFFDLRYLRSTPIAGTTAAPALADRVYIGDNSDLYNVKISTLQTIRDLYKTYFDTVYQSGLGYTPINKSGDTGVGPITFNGNARFEGGVYLGQDVVTDPQDVTRHIDLYAHSYGFSVSSVGTVSLNYMSNGNHSFYGGGTLSARLNAAGDLALVGTLTTGNNTASLSVEGSVYGPYWNDWGSFTAKVAISARIEARGAVYRDAAIAGVPARVAALTFDQVGAYSLCYINGADNITVGQSITGSRCQPCTVAGTVVAGTAGTGTFKAAGRIINSAIPQDRITVVQKIS